MVMVMMMVAMMMMILMLMMMVMPPTRHGHSKTKCNFLRHNLFLGVLNSIHFVLVYSSNYIFMCLVAFFVVENLETGFKGLRSFPTMGMGLDIG